MQLGSGVVGPPLPPSVTFREGRGRKGSERGRKGDRGFGERAGRDRVIKSSLFWCHGGRINNLNLSQ